MRVGQLFIIFNLESVPVYGPAFQLTFVWNTFAFVFVLGYFADLVQQRPIWFRC